MDSLLTTLFDALDHKIRIAVVVGRDTIYLVLNSKLSDAPWKYAHRWFIARRYCPGSRRTHSLPKGGGRLVGFDVPDLEVWNVTLQNNGDDTEESVEATLELVGVMCSWVVMRKQRWEG